MPPKTPDRRAQPAPAKPRPVTTNRAYRPSGENLLKRNIQTQLASEIGRGIVSGGYPPETILPSEAEMRARFSVSRTVLREAYSSLAAKGLIAARPKIGTRVRPKSDWNMLDPEVLAWHIQTLPNENLAEDLYVLRGMVEPPAAALAAANPAPATMKRVADAYADMVRFKDGAGDLVAADLEFHMAILQATGNYFIGALGGLIHVALITTFKLSWEGATRIQDSRLHQHRLIMEAIRDGQPALAHRRMTELLRDSIGDVREGLVHHADGAVVADAKPRIARKRPGRTKVTAAPSAKSARSRSKRPGASRNAT